MRKTIFFAVVVLYNTSIEKSITINNINKIHSHLIDILVIDNSTEITDNERKANENGWAYISMCGNAGISKAYNTALKFLRNKEDGVIIWLDDDTNITQEYFDVLEAELGKYEDVDIFTPMIQGQDGKFCSPNEYHFLRNRQLKNINEDIDNSRFNAINSCTAVRIKVYENYRYTEKLFLDQVDHQFFEDQRKIGRKFRKINVIIQHNLSVKEANKSIDSVKKRYKTMIPDFLTYCSKTSRHYYLGIMKVIGWGIREGVRYRDVSFLFWTINEVRIWIEHKKRD